MALSMDEQRILAEIERRLAADDPYLAGSLSAFTRPRLGASIKAARGRLAAAIVAVAAISLAALMIYSFVPFRVIARQNDGPPGGRTTQQARVSAPPVATTVPPPITNGPPPAPAYLPAAGPALR
jgi:hypothetical protein